ncbi:MAG TPA: peptidylprolyl isomerase, partial [Verrucomicrobiae bacterium]
MKSLGSGQSIILLLAAAAVLAGCSPKPAPEVLAQVGTNSITPADLQAECERRQAGHLVLPDKAALLDQLIDRQAMLQQARAAGLDQAPDVRRAGEDLLIAKYRDTRLLPALKALQVAPAEVATNYQNELARYTVPAKAKLAILYLAVNPRAESNQLAAAQVRAQDIAARAAALPAETRGFGQLAADFSDDQITRYRGGDAGWFTTNDPGQRWPEAVVAAGFALAKTGDLSGLIARPEGFYLVKKLDARSAEVTPLAKVEPALEHRLLAEKTLAAEKQFTVS